MRYGRLAAILAWPAAGFLHCALGCLLQEIALTASLQVRGIDAEMRVKSTP